MNGFLAVLRNEITLIRRDVLYLLLLTMGAMVTLVTMAYTLSGDIANVPTLVVNFDRGSRGRQLVQAFANDNFFALEMTDRVAEAERRLQEGSANVALVIPADYSRSIDRGEPVRVQALIDGSEPGVAELACHHIAAIASNTTQRIAVKDMIRRGMSVVPPLGYQPRIRYNAGLRTVVSVTPGLMACVLIVPAVGASAAFARERERGSFEVVISTPLGRWPLLLGRTLPYVLLGLFDIGIFTAVAHLAFDLPLRGNLLLFTLMGLLYILATASSGVLIAQFLRTQHAAAIATFMLFGIAPTYLSDIFFPISSMPRWLQGVATALPATHFTVVARGILLKGVGLKVLWPNALVMFATSVVAGTLAYWRFRKTLD